VCWDAVDERKGTLEVCSAVQRKGHRQRLVTELKTEQSRRTVQLAPDLVRALHRERIEQTERRLHARSWVESPVAFTPADGNLFPFHSLEHGSDKVCAAAGVKRVSPNGFRHSNASMLLSLGASHEEVAKHLGHKNAAQVIKTYGHVMRVLPVAALLGGI
jgi:integrase